MFFSLSSIILPGLALPALIQAGGCPPKRLGVAVHYCGRVENNTPWTLKWTELSKGSDLCHVYNWNGGDGAVGWSPKPNGQRKVQCDQHSLAKHKNKGGYAERVDVDGVTFADRRWLVIWDESGHSDDLAAGVWVKFSNAEVAVCGVNADGKVPECRIKCKGPFAGWGCVQ
ncbi:hypothetical protein LTR27_010420 [Elasticomyces elasticus]|nr:hypothetical protein LTR27_010420 [Elasticomyces elasticus]